MLVGQRGRQVQMTDGVTIISSDESVIKNLTLVYLKVQRLKL